MGPSSSSSTTPMSTGRRSNTSANGAKLSAERLTSLPGFFRDRGALGPRGRVAEGGQVPDPHRIRDSRHDYYQAIREASEILDKSLAEERNETIRSCGIGGDRGGPWSGRSRAGSTTTTSFTRRHTSHTAASNVMGSEALVGSWNFTRPGLTQNVELNIRFTGREVGAPGVVPELLGQRRGRDSRDAAGSHRASCSAVLRALRGVRQGTPSSDR